MGIVKGPGEIVAVTDTDGSRRLRIRIDPTFNDLHHDQSITVSGVCLTIEAFGDDWFEVFLTAEIIEKTYLGDAVEGDRINLKRALATDGHFDGHIVQGHVDGMTMITNAERVDDDWFFKFDLPEPLTSHIVQEDSICLDDVSLTVVDRRRGTSVVAIIPTIYDLTTLSEKAVDGPIHIEVGVAVRYAKSMLDGYTERLIVE